MQTKEYYQYNWQLVILVVSIPNTGRTKEKLTVQSQAWGTQYSCTSVQPDLKHLVHRNQVKLGTHALGETGAHALAIIQILFKSTFKISELNIYDYVK